MIFHWLINQGIYLMEAGYSMNHTPDPPSNFRESLISYKF